MPLTPAASLDGAALGLLARPPKGPYTLALRSLRLSVRTPDFQSGKTSSILVGTAIGLNGLVIVAAPIPTLRLALYSDF